MDIDTNNSNATGSATDPMNAAYLDTLPEPWKSLMDQVLPTAANATPPLKRMDQLELAVRSQFLDHVVVDGSYTGDDDNDIYQVAGQYWKATLDVCLHVVHFASLLSNDDSEASSSRYFQMTPRKLPLVLLEDAMDALPVDQMQRLWTNFVEPSLDSHLLGETLWKTSTACHLQFLKVCNVFLRAMERDYSSHNHEWKGRILWALSKAFTIADRSALKAWGSFHHSEDNASYDSPEIFDQAMVPTAPTTGATVSYNLYESFWSLQADFANPNKIKVAAFIKKVKLVLQALESAASRRSSSGPPVSTPLRYLTAASLLPSQLATPSIRASILSQFLIAGSHLSAESPALGKTLTPLLNRAKKLLQLDHPELHRLLSESLLSRGEVQWRQWKKNKCPVSAFAPRSRTGTGSTKPNALMASSALGSGSGNDSTNMYQSLTRQELYQAAEDFKQKIPSLEGHLEDYVEALDPESGIEAEYHPGNDALFAWRAMRLYAQHEASRLKECRQPADLERITRQRYLDQGKPIPGDMPPPPPAEEDSESEESESEEEEEGDKESEKDDESDKAESMEEDPKEVEEDSDAKDSPRDDDNDSDQHDGDGDDENKSEPEMEDGDAKMEDAETTEAAPDVTSSGDEDAGAKEEPEDPKEDSETVADRPATETEKSTEDKAAKDSKAEDKDDEKEVPEEKARAPGRRSRETSQDQDNRPARKGPNNNNNDRKRKRSRSAERESGGRNKMPRGGPPPRDDDRGGPDWNRSAPRGGRRDDDGRREDKNQDDGRRDDRRRDGGRREDGRRGDDNRRDSGGRREDNRRDDGRRDGGRRDEPGRSNDAPGPKGGGRRDERTDSRAGAPPRGGGPRGRPRGGNEEGTPRSGRNDRRNEESRPPMRGGGRGGGGQGGDRRDDRRAGGDRRRGGRDDSRPRGGRR